MSVDLGRMDRSVDMGTRRKSLDLKKVYSWGDVDSSGQSDSSQGRWENRKDLIESRRATWEASYRQVWVPPDGNGIGRERIGNGRGTGTTTRSWTTSSSLPEETMDLTGPMPVLPPRDEAEDDFLEEFEDYFNNLQVDNVRRKQYPKLEQQKIVYLDYANFSLYSNFQVRNQATSAPVVNI